MNPVSFNIVLVAPEIPQNTGAIGRLCVNTGAKLHLVKPLGFSLDETHLRRAGMDYWQHLTLAVYENWQEFLSQNHPEQLYFCSTKSKQSVYQLRFKIGDYLVFGNEGKGLPSAFYTDYEQYLYSIPMTGAHARSLNLANAVAIVLYEAMRQACFAK